MRIISLHVENFRNISQADLALDPGLNAIIGPNGTGKTSLLEAISLLSYAKSFRTSNVSSMVKHDEVASRINALIERDASQSKLTATVTANGKAGRLFTVDGAPLPLIRFIGTLSTILFTPDHLDIVTAEPKMRRDFIDGILARSSAQLLGNIVQLQRILRQRNQLLLRIRSGDAQQNELLSWDVPMAENSINIIKARGEMIAKINDLLPVLSKDLSLERLDLNIMYSPTCAADKDVFMGLLRDAYSKDIMLGKTSIGPHREAITILDDNKELALFGSRGEQRTAVLALKLAELDIVKEMKNDSPVLLLDDVLSELDYDHQKALLEAAKTSQTILTSASNKADIEKLLSSPRIFEMPDCINA
jgi:DNA replication and repair protein RecF